MSLKLLPKVSLQAFIETCTPLAVIPAFEQEMRERIDGILEALRVYSASGNPVDNLARFLRADGNFLGVILALANLSQEKFLRILSAERFAQQDFRQEWGIGAIQRKIRSETGFAEQIAQLFLDGRNSALLRENAAAFYLDQLSLPNHWDEIIQDENLIENVIRRKLTGEYTDRKGDAIEGIIRAYLDDIREKYGVPYDKGQVTLVDKEVDHVIPSRDDPYVMIMTSYMETTSSSQTARANEQSEMYGAVQKENRRYGTQRIFVNFVDGGGWLARRSDLRKLYDGCDYILNLKTLDYLEAIICKHVPEAYFPMGQKPKVEG